MGWTAPSSKSASNSTREPWRWMHLVCGAQAAAISFGKNMTIYEEYLELLHAA